MKYVRGERIPDPPQLVKLAEIGRVTTDWLLKGGPRQHALHLKDEARATDELAYIIEETARGYEAGLSDDEQEWLAMYRRLTAEQRLGIKKVVARLSERAGKKGK